MSLTMSTLSQMVEGFTHCYETEMKPWSGREKPQLSGKPNTAGKRSRIRESLKLVVIFFRGDWVRPKYLSLLFKVMLGNY